MNNNLLKTGASVLFAIIIFMSSSIALAWWQAEAEVEISETVVTAIITNSRNRSIFCEGRVYGRTQTGILLENWGQTTILSGRSVQLRVETDSTNSFIQGWANVRCR